MRPRRRKRQSSAQSKRHKFTKEECRRGYAAALEKCSQDWELWAWFFSRVRSWYRAKKAP